MKGLTDQRAVLAETPSYLLSHDEIITNDQLMGYECIKPEIADNYLTEEEKYEREILQFLKWFDNLSSVDLLKKTMSIPANIVIGEKALQILRDEGYKICFRGVSNDLFIQIHGENDLPGTLDN